MVECMYLPNVTMMSRNEIEWNVKKMNGQSSLTKYERCKIGYLDISRQYSRHLDKKQNWKKKHCWSL